MRLAEEMKYGKVYRLGGHRDVRDLLLDPVYVEEKIDGSRGCDLV